MAILVSMIGLDMDGNAHIWLIEQIGNDFGMDSPSILTMIFDFWNYCVWSQSEM